MEHTDDERQIVEATAQFVDRRVRPRVREFEQADIYPTSLIEEMADLGLFGLLVPEEYGGTPVRTSVFAAVTEELARGWMSLAGAIGGHSVVCNLLDRFGTTEQKETYLPGLATGSVRATMALTEPAGGSDLQALRTTARRDGDAWVLSGAKTWISNAAHAGLFAVLAKTDANADPAWQGISIMLAEPGAGVHVAGKLPKLGYRGVESCPVTFEDAPLSPHAVLGDEVGHGWRQMMSGLEVGRIQVAARAVGVAQAALDDAVAYAQQRESFGKPIWQHQAVGHLLADMATSVAAARLLARHAAERFDSGARADMEAGMAKLLASETAARVTLDAMRVHGGYGYSREYDVERYYRDAPLMILGEGTNEIQRNVIAAQLIARTGTAHRR